MIMKGLSGESVGHEKRRDSTTRLQVRALAVLPRELGYSITKRGRDYLDVGRDMGWKGRKQREREAPKRYSDAFVVFCSLGRSTAHPIPHLPEGNSTPVTGVKLLFKICTPATCTLRLPVRGQANPETVATMPF